MKMKSFSSKYSSLLVAAGIVVALDQWTKWLVKKNIPLNESWLPESLHWLQPYARFIHIENSGASFGMFQNGNTIFVLLTVLIVGGMVYYVSKLESVNKWTLIAVGIYMGGAIGNLIDRFVMGKVTDFISVGTFYIFNVADASINIAVVLLLFTMWPAEKKNVPEANLHE